MPEPLLCTLTRKDGEDAFVIHCQKPRDHGRGRGSRPPQGSEGHDATAARDGMVAQEGLYHAGWFPPDHLDGTW